MDELNNKVFKSRSAAAHPSCQPETGGLEIFRCFPPASAFQRGESLWTWTFHTFSSTTSVRGRKKKCSVFTAGLILCLKRAQEVTETTSHRGKTGSEKRERTSRDGLPFCSKHLPDAGQRISHLTAGFKQSCICLFLLNPPLPPPPQPLRRPPAETPSAEITG